MRELMAGTLPLEVPSAAGPSTGTPTRWRSTRRSRACTTASAGCGASTPTSRTSSPSGSPRRPASGPGGHIRTFETLAAAIGLTREDLTTQHLLPGARAGIDYYIRVIFEATPHEIGAVLLNEKAHGSIVFGEIYKALKRPPYSLTEERCCTSRSIASPTWSTATRIATFFTRLLEREPVQERPGWGMEYTTMTWAEIFARFFDEVYAKYRPRG